jgi:hypothetical protein
MFQIIIQIIIINNINYDCWIFHPDNLYLIIIISQFLISIEMLVGGFNPSEKYQLIVSNCVTQGAEMK